MTIEELMNRLTEIRTQLENPEFSGTSEEIDALVGEGQEIRTKIEEHNTRQTKLNEERAKLADVTLVQPLEPQTIQPETRVNPQPVETRLNPVAIAKRFSQNEALQRWIGGVREASDSNSGFQMEFPDVELRALIGSGATSGGAFGVPTRHPETIAGTEDRPLAITDLIATAPINTNQAQYVQDTSSTPYGAAAETAETGTAPESTYTFELKTATVVGVPTFANVHEDVLEDNAQLEAYLSNRVLYAAAYRIDGQILNGSGSGVNLRGILNTSGVNPRTPAAPEARLITIRKAITLTQVDEFAAKTTVINTVDWELIELSTDDTGRFRVSPDVQNAAAPRIWGTTVVATNQIASGDYCVGDFARGALLWDRKRATLEIDKSLGFLESIWKLKVRPRVALSVWRPAAFTVGEFVGDE